MPSSKVIRLTDRECDALVAPWWRRLFWTAADHRCYDRAKRIVRDGNGEVAAFDIIAEIRQRQSAGA